MLPAAAAAGGTHWAAIVSDAVTGVLVAVTAVLVAITARQVRLTREALRLTREAVVASQKEAEATAASVKESVRARVDQRAPRVVVKRVERNPFVWEPSTGEGDPNPLDRLEIMSFRVPKQNDQPLFVQADLYLLNEGLSSALVNCSAVEFVASPAGVARAFFVLHEGKTYEDLGSGPLWLGAGEELYAPYFRSFIRVELQCPVGVWLANPPIEAELTIGVVDSQEPGIVDEIPVRLSAWPLAIADNDSGQALVRQSPPNPEPDPPLVQCTVGRSRRRYHGEA